MLFHLSIAARDPRHVAQVIAEFWRGDAFPFPPVAVGSWIAVAGDDRGTAMEVYPLGIVLREAEGDADSFGEQTEQTGYTATHAALATPLSQAEVMAIASREGWPAKYRKRGGAFGVIELWIEGRQMVELLTQEMQAEYLAATTMDNFRAMMKAMGPA
ncbi:MULTISPECIES: hypothetical protein [Sphingobium]|uniref:hypothetical protein n=1 Tax=Sphingobium TaxID=165695 RepID=UPI00159C2803|nr:hypothetical protein [Sphingobium sp. 15-1]